MIGAPVPGVVNALQVTIPGRSPSVPSVKALGNARDEKKKKKCFLGFEINFLPLFFYFRKRGLEIPPDPRSHFERRSAFTNSFFTPPCFSDLEQFYIGQGQIKKAQIWSQDQLNKNLDQLEKSKCQNVSKKERVNIQ